MAITELIVIYLACGAPFGVHRLTCRNDVRPLRKAADVAAHFVLWPIFAAALFLNWLPGLRRAVGSDLDVEIAKIRKDIEIIAYDSRSASAVFEFREIYARFTGLTLGLIDPSTTSHRIFEIDGRQDMTVANKCLDRSNRQRIAFHQVRARNEFVDLISTLARTQPHGDQIVGLGLDLTLLLGEREAFDDMSVLSPQASLPSTGFGSVLDAVVPNKLSSGALRSAKAASNRS